MKVIYLGLESRGKHHCQSLFKVVRYFSSKERAKEREPKVQTWLKLNISKISTKYQKTQIERVCSKLKGKHWHQIKSEGSRPAREQ